MLRPAFPATIDWRTVGSLALSCFVVIALARSLADGHTATVNLLLRNDADVEATTATGNTAHDLADAGELGPALMAKLKPSKPYLTRKRKAAAALSSDLSTSAAAISANTPTAKSFRMRSTRSQPQSICT